MSDFVYRRLFSSRSSLFGCGSVHSAVLFGDLLQDAGQAGNGGQHGTQDVYKRQVFIRRL